MGSAPHVVWDWNGTLLDDNSAMLAAVNDVCAAYGVASITMSTWRAALQRPLWLCYSKVLGIELTEDDWPRVEHLFHDSYRQRLLEAGLNPGATEALARLDAAGFTQSILSMGFHDDVMAQVDAAGITGVFRAVDGVRTEVSGGPKAAYLVAHLRGLGVDPAATVLIGDIADDAEAAHAVGARVILVATGMSDHAMLATTGEQVADSIPAAAGMVLGAMAGASGALR